MRRVHRTAAIATGDQPLPPASWNLSGMPWLARGVRRFERAPAAGILALLIDMDLDVEASRKQLVDGCAQRQRAEGFRIAHVLVQRDSNVVSVAIEPVTASGDQAALDAIGERDEFAQRAVADAELPASD